ncbi:MAG TPA: LuxR family transcriptional regulator, partial [Actinomycetota bacterium]|nr:LuxR family transcriptional regulator [Actinomycetota bacterium]
MSERITQVDLARDAAASGAWRDAYRLLSSIDGSGLGAEDLEHLADAAWWLSRFDESFEVRRRAYASFAASGDDLGAGRAATRLCIEHFLRQEAAVAGGWLKRAERHLHDLPEASEQGFLAVVQATVARFGGDLNAASRLSQRATQIGRRLADRDLVAMGIHTEGLVRIAAGDVEEGVALLDEAMTSVVAGELSDYFTGAVYCNVLDACLGLADLRRAGEWNDAARAWCESLPPDSPYPGFCRVNRAEVAALRGSWSEAEAEAMRAAEELMRVNPMNAAPAFYEAGEIRRRMGDAGGAEEAFARARELGLEPQPGLALLRLQQGKVEAAGRGLKTASAAAAGSPLRRATLLGAMVEVALAAGDLDAATT